MCTVLIAHGVLPDRPVFLAANRDEFYDRPSEPPRLRGSNGSRWFGPSDRRAQGTWIGVNQHGLFAVITNRSDLRMPATAGERSRGLLVRTILESDSLGSAVARWQQDVASPSQPFNLVFGSAEQLLVGTRDQHGAGLRPLPSGIHAISNFGPPDAKQVGETARALTDWDTLRDRGVDPWEAASAILRSRRDGNRPGLEKEHGERGTVSSTILGIAPGGDVRYLHAEGAPSRTEFRVTDPVSFDEDLP